MRKLLFGFVALAAIAACDRADVDAGITCGAYDVTVAFDDANADTLHAVLNGDAVDLVRAVAASGAKYQGVLNDTTVVLWEKGENWTLMLDEDTIIECIAK